MDHHHVAAIRAEHRARIADAERYGHHRAELTRLRRRRRPWTSPTVRRPRRFVARPAIAR